MRIIVLMVRLVMVLIVLTAGIALNPTDLMRFEVKAGCETTVAFQDVGLIFIELLYSFTFCLHMRYKLPFICVFS